MGRQPEVSGKWRKMMETENGGKELILKNTVKHLYQNETFGFLG